MDYKEMYLDFSIDFDGQIEYIDDFTIGDEDHTDDINEDDVFGLVEVLQEVEGFMVSDHRTEVRMWWTKDGKTRILFNYYNEPEDGEFDNYELNVPYIDFKFTLGED